MTSPTPVDGEMTWHSSWTLLLPNGLAPWDGVEKAHITLSLPVHLLFLQTLVPGGDLASVLFSRP